MRGQKLSELCGACAPGRLWEKRDKNLGFYRCVSFNNSKSLLLIHLRGLRHSAAMPCLFCGFTVPRSVCFILYRRGCLSGQSACEWWSLYGMVRRATHGSEVRSKGWQALVDLLDSGTGNFSRTGHEVDAFCEGGREEILGIIDYRKHCI